MQKPVTLTCDASQHGLQQHTCGISIMYTDPNGDKIHADREGVNSSGFRLLQV